MTEGEDPFREFRQQAADAEERLRSVNAEFEAIDNQIAAALAMCDGMRIWHHDPAQREANYQLLLQTVYSQLVEHEPDGTDQLLRAELIAKRYFENERILILAIVLHLKRQNAIGREVLEQTDDKKKLMITAMMSRVDERWLQAIDLLLAGDPLDLSQEADQALYAQRELETTRDDPLASRVFEILGDNPANSELQNEQVKVSLGPTLIIGLAAAQYRPDSISVVEETIRRYAAGAQLTSNQVTALLQLLTEITTPPAAE